MERTGGCGAGRAAAVVLAVAALLAMSLGLGLGSPPAASGEASPARDRAAPGGRAVAADAVTLARGRALDRAEATGRSVPIAELTTENQRVWAQPDGLFKAEIASGPVRAKRDGRWEDIDLTLQRTADGQVAPRRHLHDLVLSGGAGPGDHELAVLGRGDERRALGWSGRLPAPRLDGHTATYPDVLPGIDLVVEARMTGYEQHTVVKDPAAVAHVPAALAALRVDDGTPGTDGDSAGETVPDGRGGLRHTDAEGTVIGRTPTPLMWDAEVDATGAPAAPREVGLSEAPGDTGFGLAPDDADVAWLRDPSRRFPITIDPGDQRQNSRGDTFAQSSSPNTYDFWNDSELEIGTQNSGGTKRTAYVNFSAQGMAEATIWQASIELWGTALASNGSCVNGQWQIFAGQSNAHSRTTWNNRPYLIDGHGQYLGSQNGNGAEGPYTKHPLGESKTPPSGRCTGEWQPSDARGLFQYAANHGWWEFTAVITPLWDNTNNFSKRFGAYESGMPPRAIVYYSWPPSLTGRSTHGSGCAAGDGRPTVGSVTPTLSATYNQGEGIASDVTIEWSRTDGTVLGEQTVHDVASDAPANVTVPAGHFARGGTYRWRTRALSNWNALRDWSDHCELRVETWAGPVAGCPGAPPPGPGPDPADFDGDGQRDVVIADPLATVGSAGEAGVVHVVGGATGARRTLSQDSDEVPETAEPGDRFAAAVAVVDLNLDGCSDLAVASPNEDLNVVDAGRVDVLYGTPAGLGKGPAAESFIQGVDRVPGPQVANDWFGYALAGGRTAGGEPFLVVGAPGDDVGGAGDAGTVTYIRGEHRIAVDQAVHSGQAAELDDRGGLAVAATAQHIAVAYPGESMTAASATRFGGRVCVLTHAVSGGRLGTVGCVDQDTAGPITGDGPIVQVTDEVEAGDTFGKAVSMAPYRGPGQPAGSTDSILAVGVPGEDRGSAPDTGIVQQFRVRSSGPASDMKIIELATVSQATAGVAGDDQPGDPFGEQVAVANSAPGAEATATNLLLAVGLPGQDRAGGSVDAGVVQVFAAGTVSIGASRTVERGSGGGLPGTPAARELVGISLASTGTDLLVATPYLGQQGVHALAWSDLAAGQVTARRSWTPGPLGVTGARAFGAPVR